MLFSAQAKLLLQELDRSLIRPFHFQKIDTCFQVSDRDRGDIFSLSGALVPTAIDIPDSENK
jgi:hypothetical protein